MTLSIVASALEQGASTNAILPGGFSEINVAELISKCDRTVRHAACEAGIHLNNEIDAVVPNLIANAPALTQIILNLLTNAIKFTPAGGSVSISTASPSDGSFALAIADTGVGMTGDETLCADRR